MQKYPLHKLLKKNQLLDFSHSLVLRFFERRTKNIIVISAVEIIHLGKNIRLLNTAMILQSIYDVPSNKIHVSLDATDTLLAYLSKHSFDVDIKSHNTWAENAMTATKKIDIVNLEAVLYDFFMFYRNLCIDNNMPIDAIPLD